MNCFKAQEQILETLTEGHPLENQLDLKGHVAGCDACQAFLETQISLDRQLTAAMTASALSPAFRASLARRIRREPLTAWPEFLPDFAHVAGCACATAVCVTVLPFPAATVILAGAAFTLVTYFVQTTIRGSLEALESDQ